MIADGLAVHSQRLPTEGVAPFHEVIGIACWAVVVAAFGELGPDARKLRAPPTQETGTEQRMPVERLTARIPAAGGVIWESANGAWCLPSR